MARSEANLSCFGFSQELNPDYWDWSDVEKQFIKNGDLFEIGKIIKRRLEESGCLIDSFYLVKHDRDTKEEWDTSLSEMIVVPKLIHLHGFVKFIKNKGSTLTNIADSVGIAMQYCEKAKAGRYGWDNMISYATHIKYPDKYQYDYREVLTVCGRSYEAVYQERKSDWLKGRAKILTEKCKVDIDYLESLILEGKVNRDMIMSIEEYFNIYSRNRKRCRDALASYTERRIFRAIQAMDRGEFLLTVFYITGKPGDGKSYFSRGLAKHIVAEAKKKYGDTWEIYEAGTKNPLDNYAGQEVVLMDDLRGIAMDASDWLTLLNEDSVGQNSARYENTHVPCRVLIINAYKDIVEFFYYLKSKGDEDMNQFIRRITDRIEVIKLPNGDRKYLVDEIKQVKEYEKMAPDSWSKLTLNYAPLNVSDMDFDEAMSYLTDKVMSRNGLDENSIVKFRKNCIESELPEVPSEKKEQPHVKFNKGGIRIE